MSKTDFQNGFALGMASGGVVEVDYVEYPLPQDNYVYYRYPPCNEERYIQIGVSTIEYGTLNANGYTKVDTMEGVIEDSIYKFTIPAHTKDFIIKLSSMPTYLQSSAECTEVSCGIVVNPAMFVRSSLYMFTPLTINGFKKITFNKGFEKQQAFGVFNTSSVQTLNLKSVNSTNSNNMFANCLFLNDLQFEEMILANLNSTFSCCISLTTIDCSKITPSGTLINAFFGCSSLKTLDLSSWASQCSTFTSINGLFRFCNKLKTINLSGWDLSRFTIIYDWFDGNESLENIILNDATLFSASFSVAKCLKLNSESIVAIFNALPTLAEGTTKTLTLNANHKILQSQVDSANAKGWTVAGGKVVSEEEYYG